MLYPLEFHIPAAIGLQLSADAFYGSFCLWASCAISSSYSAVIGHKVQSYVNFVIRSVCIGTRIFTEFSF